MPLARDGGSHTMSALDDPIDAFMSIPEAFCPKASPNDEWVACCWNATGQYDLHARHVETGGRRQLTDGMLPSHPEEITYRWDAESDGLLYQIEHEERTSVHRSALEGPTEQLFVEDGDIHLWAVNPQTSEIYYRVGDDTVRWRDPDTCESGEFDRFPGLSLQIPATCAVSPDGRWVAYTSRPPAATGTEDTTFESGLTTFIAAADGSNPRQITPPDAGRRLTPVQWHPDSTELLVQRDDGHWRDGRTFGVYDPAEDSVEWLGDAGAVAFLDGGDQILVGAPPRSAIELYDRDGHPTPVDCDGQFHLCTGSEATVGAAGFVVQRTTEDHPYQVVYHNVATEETTTLFGAKYDGLGVAPEMFIDSTTITYPYSDDDDARGLLYQSTVGDGSGPGVVIFSGGRSRWSQRFRPHVQLLCHLGYTVLLADCPVDGWSHEEHTAFAAAGRWLASQEVIDAERIAAYGHSHGGYNVYMQAVQYPDLWGAFVADTGCVDLHTAKSVGNLHRQLGDPDDNADLYRDLSPISSIDDHIGSPLLMIHGENDAWAEQPRVFEQKLLNRGWIEGDEYEYVELPNVGHSPKSRAAQTHRWRTVCEFLDDRL